MGEACRNQSYSIAVMSRFGILMYSQFYIEYLIQCRLIFLFSKFVTKHLASTSTSLKRNQNKQNENECGLNKLSKTKKEKV